MLVNAPPARRGGGRKGVSNRSDRRAGAVQLQTLLIPMSSFQFLLFLSFFYGKHHLSLLSRGCDLQWRLGLDCTCTPSPSPEPSASSRMQPSPRRLQCPTMWLALGLDDLNCPFQPRQFYGPRPWLDGRASPASASSRSCSHPAFPRRQHKRLRSSAGGPIQLQTFLGLLLLFLLVAAPT